jgi:heat shock protein HtpX
LAITIFNQISRNKNKSFFLIIFFILFLSLLGFILGTALGLSEEEIIGSVVFAVFLSSISAIISWYFSDKIVLVISKAKELNPDSSPEAREIYRLVENVAIRANIPIPRIYIVDDSAPNAFATGRNPKKGVIALTTGIIDELDRQELEGVIAHEAAHIQNFDIRFMTLVTVLVGTTSLVSDLFLRATFWSAGGKKSDNNQAQVIFMILGIVFAILAPIIAALIQFAISRKREFLADASAAQITRNPMGLASALRKISEDKEPLEVANSATAHLYIANPLKKDFVHKLFSTHPKTEDRIKALEEMV